MPTTIKIKSGDTLSGLAKSNGTTVDALLRANPNITNPNLIIAGASLNLPTVPVSSPAPATPTPTPSPTPAPAGATGSAAYNIKSGDTLSAIAKAQGTSISELMRLNPNIKNPNLIYSGQTLNIPQNSGFGAGQTDYSTVNSMAEANKAINENQQADKASATTTSEPPTRKTTNDVLAEILGTDKVDITKSAAENAKSAITPETAKPEAPNLVSTYQNYRTQYGIDTLETSLNDLSSKQAQILADQKALATKEKGKTVAMNVIEGRISEEAQQANDALAEVQTQIKSISDQLTTKYNVVNTLMNLTEKDYDNASQSYNQQMTNNISMFNILKGVSEDQKSDEEKAVDDARSSLQIVYNSITNGGQNISDLTDDQKVMVTKLEAQSGLPIGFYQTLQNKNPKAEIVATYNWTSSDNTEYASVLTKDPTTGEIKTNNIRLGTAKKTSTTENDMTSEEKKFNDDISKQISNLAEGGSWASAYYTLAGIYGRTNPDLVRKLSSDEILNAGGIVGTDETLLDIILNKSKYYKAE